MRNVFEEIINLIEFYQALGFEFLPLKLDIKNQFNKNTKGKYKATDKNLLYKKSALDNLVREINDCKRCKLSGGRTNIVFGEGDPEAEIMFVGEAPGKEEDLQGRPFVGDAGMLLTRLIKKMGYKREDVYIANVVKCRPPMNREPEPDEIEACKGFLERQIEIIKPKVIIALGKIAALTLIGDTKLKITAIRGNFFDYKGIPLMPTFHPAYLIRNPRDKWLTWADVQKVLEKLKN